ncbi:MAG: hypothetical protein P8Y75_04795 [Nitrospirota bacterium]|jgi:hypothetical protein
MRIWFAAAVLLVFLAGCSKGVRYSPSEIDAFSPDVQEHIKKGEIALGMSPTAVRYAWGAPKDVKIPGPDKQGRFVEIWIYGRFPGMETKLIFADGVLTGLMGNEKKPLIKIEPPQEAR